jgi:hypothetical protein
MGWEGKGVSDEVKRTKRWRKRGTGTEGERKRKEVEKAAKRRGRTKTERQEIQKKKKRWEDDMGCREQRVIIGKRETRGGEDETRGSENRDREGERGEERREETVRRRWRCDAKTEARERGWNRTGMKEDGRRNRQGGGNNVGGKETRARGAGVGGRQNPNRRKRKPRQATKKSIETPLTPCTSSELLNSPNTWLHPNGT